MTKNHIDLIQYADITDLIIHVGQISGEYLRYISKNNSFHY